MHPNQAFRLDDRAPLLAMVHEVGFGMVFAATPDGPRVAHVPLLVASEEVLHFHLSNGNALTRHLADKPDTAVLAVINGPDAYISPRWYDTRGQVPTWNYVALELEGRVSRLPTEQLEQQLRGIGQREEGRIDGGEPWQPDSVPAEKWHALLRGITGFALHVQAWRPTFKLSQNKPAPDVAGVAQALEDSGKPAVAALMRQFAQ